MPISKTAHGQRKTQFSDPQHKIDQSKCKHYLRFLAHGKDMQGNSMLELILTIIKIEYANQLPMLVCLTMGVRAYM